MKLLARLSVATVVAVFLVIFLGGLVRVSDAGLGCPDWPKCYGYWLPPTSAKSLPPEIHQAAVPLAIVLAWIEYANRMVGAVLGLMILAVTALAWRQRHRIRLIFPSALAALVLVGVVAWLGGKVVYTDLKPILVSVHLGGAVLLTCLLIIIAFRAQSAAAPGPSVPRPTAPRAPHPARATFLILWIMSGVQICLGANLRGRLDALTGASPFLSDGGLLSGLGGWKFAHMALGLAIAAGILFAGRNRLNKGGRAGAACGLTHRLLCFLVCAQIGMGMAFPLAGLVPILRLFHLWVATLTCALLLLLTLQLGAQREPAAPDADSDGTATARAWIFRAAYALLLLVAIGVATVKLAGHARQLPPRTELKLPDFAFFSHHGQPVRSVDFGGQIIVLDLFFTSCTAVCPMMTERMAHLYELYAGEDRVQFLSVSIDSKTDTIGALDEYAERFGIRDSRWFLLSGAPDEIKEFAENGLGLSAGIPMGHSSKFVLIDPDGYIRGFYAYDNESSMELLKMHIRQLARDQGGT